MSALARAAETAASTGIKWDAFGLVFIVALVATTVIAGSYSLGLRLLATGAGSTTARSAAVACFAVGVAAVLFGLWLVVPQFHG